MCIRFSGIYYISRFTNDKVYGFDSFEGLPEKWRDGYDKGALSTNGKLPIVNTNVELIKGWFNETLLPFIQKHNGKKVSFIHMDADIYSSTKYVLNILKGVAGDYAGIYTLETVAQKVSQTERYTDWWDPNGDCKSTANEMSMIDHVLMTPNLLDKVVNVFMPHPYSEYCGTYNSDHYPTVVDLEL